MGQLPGIGDRIPQDVKDRLPTEERAQFIAFADSLLEAIYDAKRKRFTCDTCHKHGKNPTKNKKAYQCDFCKSWDKTLYNVKD
jgi:recombinational DNA repair protein RecR